MLLPAMAGFGQYQTAAVPGTVIDLAGLPATGGKIGSAPRFAGPRPSKPVWT